MKPDLIMCIGPGGTGKTTFCNALEKALVDDGAKFYTSSARKFYANYCADPVFGPDAKITADKEGYDPIFQKYLKRSYLEEFARTGRHHQDLDKQFVIMDRSPLCHMAYAQYGALKQFQNTDACTEQLNSIRRQNYLFLGEWLGFVETYFSAVHFVHFSFIGKPETEIIQSYKWLASRAEDGFRDTSATKNAALDNLMCYNYLKLREYCEETFLPLKICRTAFTPHSFTPEEIVRRFIQISLLEF